MPDICVWHRNLACNGDVNTSLRVHTQGGAVCSSAGAYSQHIYLCIRVGGCALCQVVEGTGEAAQGIGVLLVDGGGAAAGQIVSRVLSVATSFLCFGLLSASAALPLPRDHQVVVQAEVGAGVTAHPCACAVIACDGGLVLHNGGVGASGRGV